MRLDLGRYSPGDAVVEMAGIYVRLHDGPRLSICNCCLSNWRDADLVHATMLCSRCLPFLCHGVYRSRRVQNMAFKTWVVRRWMRVRHKDQAGRDPQID